MNRLFYLIKNNSNIVIVLKYIKSRILSLLEKKNRKKIVSEYRHFLNSKNLTQDWFSHNSYDWNLILKDFKDKDFHYLEIGSFEGNSTMFILNFCSNVKVVCVDAWNQFTKGNEELPLKQIEQNFDKNISPYIKRCQKFKMKSSEFFFKNNQEFNIIYVDGSHHAKDVMEDCMYSWKVLQKNGILIIDDYFWIGYEDNDLNPIIGINEFLRRHKKEYSVLKVSKYQLFIKKLTQ